MRDRASVNNVATDTLKIVYPQVLDVGCFSHTLDHVGEHICSPVLDEFVKGWIGLFSRSCLEISHRSSYSATRWWSRWEVIKQIHDTFGDVERFIVNGDSLPQATKARLQGILLDPIKRAQLMVEVAITVDAGEPFVKATYTLEGDGPLALICYEKINELRAAITVVHYPNTRAVTRTLSQGNAIIQQQQFNYALSCIQPAYNYFNTKFDVDLKETLGAIQVCLVL